MSIPFILLNNAYLFMLQLEYLSSHQSFQSILLLSTQFSNCNIITDITRVLTTAVFIFLKDTIADFAQPN